MGNETIEAVARALWDLQRNGRFTSWDGYNAPWQDEYRAQARAAIAAYEASRPDLEWQRRGTRVYFRGEFEGGFDVRGCPEPERLAQAIVDGMNARHAVPAQGSKS